MSDDIVERLRAWRHDSWPADPSREAAAEIERLRREVAHWREARQAALDGGDVLHEEIERLYRRINWLCKRLNRLEQALRYIAGLDHAPGGKITASKRARAVLKEIAS